ncbi:MAG: hypothetical protein ACFE91_13010 [Promethearchaeota archaeon]
MKRFKLKLETLGIVFIIIFSSITPIFLMNYSKTITNPDEDNQDNLLDDTNDILNEISNNTEEFSDYLIPKQESQESVNISFDGENYRIEEHIKHKLNDSALFDSYQFGKTAEISDIVEFNYDREIINNFYIISEKKIGELISDSIQKTLKSYIELAKYYKFEISDKILNNLLSYLQQNVNSDDFIVLIEWEFHNGLTFSTYGIYESIKSTFIFDPILNSFPKSYLSEEKTIMVFSNNTIVSGVSGTLSRQITLYYYFFNIRVDWCRIDYVLNYRYAVTPVANGEIIQTFDWTFSATKILLHWTGAIDIHSVIPEYALPFIRFYFSGDLKDEKSHAKTETQSQSSSVSCSFSQSSGQIASIDYSFIYFKFNYGFKYLLSETMIETYGSTSSAETVTGVSPIQFQSIYTTVTDVILGVDFTINVKIKNINDFSSKCTLSVNSDSLKRNGKRVLKIKAGTPSKYTETLDSDEEKTFSFTFTPVLGDLITVQFDSSLRIYEDYYYISSHQLKKSSQTKLGPTRSNSDTIDIDINDDVPAFDVDIDDVEILNYNEFFEPGDDIVIKINNLENIGTLTAYILEIEVYLVGENNPITSYSTSDVVSGSAFDVLFPEFTLTSFGSLPATKYFYFKFSYTWYGNPTPLEKEVFDDDPIQILFDLMEPTIDFVLEDSGDWADSTVDSKLEIDYKGNRLYSFSYDIDTYKRKLYLEPTISVTSFFTGLLSLIKRSTQGTIQNTLTVKLAGILGSLSSTYRSAETMSKFQKWGLVVLADLAGFGYYLAMSAQKNEWEEDYKINIKEGEEIYEPSDGSKQLVQFDINKKPLLEGAAGNLLLAAILPNYFCKTFTEASYKFKISMNLVDVYGNVRTYETTTDSYEKGEVRVGKVLGINVFKELLGFKDLFICQATSFLLFAAIYAVLAALPWFTAAYIRPAIVCLALGLLYLALAELTLFAGICVYLLLDPDQENNDISEIELTNFANNSALGIGNNFIESIYGIQATSEDLISNVLEQTNSMANGEDVDYSLDESYENFENATTEFGRTVDLYSQEIEGTEMEFIDTDEFNNTFDETVSLINNTGCTPVIKSLGTDIGINNEFLDSIEKPGLIYGNPEPLKNASLWISYCVLHTVNVTGYTRAYSDVSEYNAINYMVEKEDITPSNISIQDLSLLEQYSNEIESFLEQEEYESALAKCDLLELTVDQIISNTHNTSIIGYKTFALLTKDHIQGMKDFAPSIYSDKNYYEIGDNIEISTEIYNMAYFNDTYYIYVEDSPSFINLNYDTLISVNSTDKSDTITQQFIIPFDWHISAGIYNITILVGSVRFEKTRTITLSFEILPFHNTTILQQQSQIALKPGENEILEYKVKNYGNIVEYFKINVSAINSTWFDIDSDFIIVESGATINFPINISIPYSNTISPSNYTIETTFEGYLLETYRCELIILPFYEFYLEYIPLDKTVLIPGESAISLLFIKNLGNTPINVKINVTDKKIQKWFNISSPIQLQVGEWINLSCYLTPERIYSTVPGMYNFSLYVNIMEDPNVFNIIDDSFTVQEFYDSEIFAVNSSIETEIGDSVDYLFNVTNLGNTISEFSLDSFLWNTSIVNNWTTIITSYLILNSGESGILKININVPYFWDNMDSIHATCLVEINCLNETKIWTLNVSLTLESTPKNMIYYLINRINRLYNDIDQATDSCKKYYILKSLKSSILLLNASLSYFSNNYFNFSVILDIFSRSRLQFIGLLTDCCKFYNFFNISFSIYLKNELLDIQDQISLLAGVTTNIALKKEVGTDISLLQIKNNMLFRILDTYDLKKYIRYYINYNFLLIDRRYSFLYIHAVFNNSKWFQATTDYLYAKYTCFLQILHKFYAFELISTDCYYNMLNIISEIQTDLPNLTL